MRLLIPKLRSDGLSQTVRIHDGRIVIETAYGQPCWLQPVGHGAIDLPDGDYPLQTTPVSGFATLTTTELTDANGTTHRLQKPKALATPLAPNADATWVLASRMTTALRAAKAFFSGFVYETTTELPPLWLDSERLYLARKRYLVIVPLTHRTTLPSEPNAIATNGMWCHAPIANTLKQETLVGVHLDPDCVWFQTRKGTWRIPVHPNRPQTVNRILKRFLTEPITTGTIQIEPLWRELEYLGIRQPREMETHIVFVRDGTLHTVESTENTTKQIVETDHPDLPFPLTMLTLWVLTKLGFTTATYSVHEPIDDIPRLLFTRPDGMRVMTLAANLHALAPNRTQPNHEPVSVA